MKLEFSAPIEELTIANPVINTHDKVASSLVTDAKGEPFVIKIHTTVEEKVHNAKNRAWVDVALCDEDCVNVFQQLDDVVLNSVYEQHHTAEWFNKKAPRDIIAEYCKSFIESKKSKPNPFLRLKTSYTKGEPRIEHRTSTESNPDGANVAEISSLEELVGKEVVYEVQVGSIRFCPTTFNPELKLVSVSSIVDKEDYNLFEMILNNDTHKQQKDKIREQQQRMEEYTENLRQLETLKEEVEKEVVQIMAKQEDVNQRYQETMEQIQRMQEDCSLGPDGEDLAEEDVVDSAVVLEDSNEDVGNEDVQTLSTDGETLEQTLEGEGEPEPTEPTEPTEQTEMIAS